MWAQKLYCPHACDWHCFRRNPFLPPPRHESRDWSKGGPFTRELGQRRKTKWWRFPTRVGIYRQWLWCEKATTVRDLALIRALASATTPKSQSPETSQTHPPQSTPERHWNLIDTTLGWIPSCCHSVDHQAQAFRGSEVIQPPSLEYPMCSLVSHYMCRASFSCALNSCLESGNVDKIFFCNSLQWYICRSQQNIAKNRHQT